MRCCRRTSTTRTASTSRPALQTEHAIAGVLDLRQHMRRKENRLPLARGPRESSSTTSRRTVGSRLAVGSSRITSGTSRREHREGELLPHAGRHLPHAAGEVELQPFALVERAFQRCVAQPARRTAASGGHSIAGRAGVAGQVGELAMDGDRSRVAIEAADALPLPLVGLR